MSSNRFPVIKFPLEIVKQSEFHKKIEAVDLIVEKNVEYLKTLIESSQKICHVHTKEIIKIINSTIKKLGGTEPEENEFLAFLNGLLEMNECIENQIGKNNIFLSSKKHENIVRINQMINSKLEKAGETIESFFNLVREYNSLGERYIKKCEYFNNIEKNPINYYSVIKNEAKFNKICKIEEDLERKLEVITTCKNEIKVMMIELSIKITEFYESIRLKVEDLRKIAQVVLHRVVEAIQPGPKITKINEASEWAEESDALSHKDVMKSSKQWLSDPRHTETLKQQLKRAKKQIRTRQERKEALEDLILNFLHYFSTIIHSIVVELNEIEQKADYKMYQSEKAFMKDLISAKCLQDIDIIEEQCKNLRSIYGGVEIIVTKDVFEAIFKRRKIYFNRYLEQIDHMLERLSKISAQDDESLLSQFKEKQSKFEMEEQKWTRQFVQQFKQTFSRYQKQFVKKTEAKYVARVDKKTDLFSHKNFEILKLPYFEHNKSIESIIRSEYMIKYEQIMKSDRIKRVVFELEAANNVQNEGGRMVHKTKSSCCGCFSSARQASKKQEEGLLERLKKSKEIDSFSCALKNNYMLYQGGITICRQYLRFHSSFNPSTFIGSTQLFIPKYDICEIIKGKHIMSLLITVVTKRGNIEFTSFLTDPFDVLVDTYMSNRKTEYESPTCQNMISSQRPELESLKNKMIEEFLRVAQQKKFKITKVNTRDYENSIELQFFYLDQQNSKQQTTKMIIPMIFVANVKYYDNSSLEYVFRHSDNQSKARKQELEEIITRIINQDRMQKVDHLSNEVNEDKPMDDNISFNIGEQVSVIGEKEKHKFDFGGNGLDNGDRNRSISNFMFSMEREPSMMREIRLNRVPESHVPVTELVNQKKVSFGPQVENILDQLKEPEQRRISINNQPVSVPSQPRSPANLAQHSRTNEFDKKSSQDRSISNSAQTIKYGDRTHSHRSTDRNRSHEHTRTRIKVNKQEQAIRSEGIKNIVVLICIAIGLLSIINIFV